MLGTRVIMMGLSHSPINSTAQPKAEMLCAANHEIPLFWLLLFSAEDVVLFPVQNSADNLLDQPPGNEYPLLIAERETVMERLNQVSAVLLPCLSESDQALLQRWLDFLQSQQDLVIAVDTYELWCNSQHPEQLFTEIVDRLKALDKGLTTPEKLLESLCKQGVWLRDNAIALSGYGW